MPAWSLVGGLAVMVQLAEAHRATDDLDGAGTNDDGELDAAMTVLVEDGLGERRGDGIVLANGARFDAIDVGAIDPTRLPDLDDPNRWFAVSHVWAVRTAVQRDLLVLGAGDAVVTEVTVPVATPAALVAMKLQSHRSRRRTPAKRASDVYDMYRLLVTHDRDGGVAGALSTAPDGLARQAAGALEETFVAEGRHWSRQLRAYDRGGAMGRVGPEDLEVVGGLCADLLRQRLD